MITPKQALSQLSKIMGEDFTNLEIAEFPSPIFYIVYDGLAHFYQPDIMIRRGHIRISGSIGFALTDRALNGGLSVDSALDPKNGCIASLRLENFLHLIDMGIVKSGEEEKIPYFVKALMACMDNNLPRDIPAASELLTNKRSWLYMLLKNSGGDLTHSSYRKVYSSLGL